MRRRGRRPVLLGLTGGIAMGKSEAARAFRRLGVPVFDADAAVHELLAPGGKAQRPVAEAFPEAARGGRIDRARLGAQVFGDRRALARLEGIVHPLVAEAQARFVRACRTRRVPVAVLDIPLLFETGAERACDYVAVVSAPAFVQRRRALARPGMTEARLAAVRARQMSDREKRRRADFVIPTGGGREVALRAIRRILTMIDDSPACGARAWRRHAARDRPRH